MSSHALNRRHFAGLIAPTSAYVLFLLLGPIACQSHIEQQAAEVPLAPITVRTQPAVAKTMPKQLFVTGTLVANQHADVAANAVGKVLQTFVERGQSVLMGGPLVELDRRTSALSAQEAKAMLAQAESQRTLADGLCERNRKLFDSGAISHDEWDRIAANCQTTKQGADAAMARADLAQKTLSDAIVRAPFKGTVDERFVSVGEYVAPQTKVATLVDVDVLRLKMTVPEAELHNIRLGQEVQFTTTASKAQTFLGQVQHIGAALQEAGRDLVIEARVDNANHQLFPGMFARAALALDEQQLPAVAKTSLRTVGQTHHLFVVAQGRLIERVVALGPEKDDCVGIIEGVQVGEQVVVNDAPSLRDGLPVTL